MESVKERAYEFLVKHNLGKIPQDFIELGDKEIGFKIYAYDSSKEITELIETLNLREVTEKKLALTTPTSSGHVILYDKNIPASEKNFVIAHEIGHIILKHTVYNHVLGKSKDKHVEAIQEKEADAFALSLVCPAPVFLEMNRRSIDEISRIMGVSSEIARLAVPEIEKEQSMEKTRIEEELLFIFRESIEKYCKKINIQETESKKNNPQHHINLKLIVTLTASFSIITLVFSVLLNSYIIKQKQLTNNDVLAATTYIKNLNSKQIAENEISNGAVSVQQAQTPQGQEVTTPIIEEEKKAVFPQEIKGQEAETASAQQSEVQEAKTAPVQQLEVQEAETAPVQQLESVSTQNIIENTVYITKTGKKYHNLNCGYVNGKTNITTLKLSEAIERGLTPCSRCKPNEKK